MVIMQNTYVENLLLPKIVRLDGGICCDDATSADNMQYWYASKTN